MRERSIDCARGTTFAELMVAISIVGVALMVMLTQVSISFRETEINDSMAFASRKAMAILAEVQSGVERGDIPDTDSLEALADLAGPNPVLTTLLDENGTAFAPDHPMSENVLRSGQWLWGRVVEVAPYPHQQGMRFLRVSICRRRDSGSWESVVPPLAIVLALPAKAFTPTAEYDVFVLAVAEAPSLWLPMASARALLENARDELQTVDSGLRLRLHWITKLGYGRDPLYTPFVNTETPASAVAPSVYWYPGVLDGAGSELYSAALFSGRIRAEDGVRNDFDAAENPHPHAVADQFNHCLRLPEARALFDARVAAGLEDENEPPLQILLEDMWRDPERYRNAIVINLHGPGLPMPPLRNFSDPAKDPTGRPGVRVVTHPRTLWTRRVGSGWQLSDPVVLRVYAYKTDPAEGSAVLAEPITIQIPGVDLTAGVNTPGVGDHLQIRRLAGGIDRETGAPGTGVAQQYMPWLWAPEHGAAVQPFEMSYAVGYASSPEPHTWIKLYNTPLVAPLVVGGGLAPSERLYGLEYVPSPVAAQPGPSQDLFSPGTGGAPKNTARWEISLPQKLLDPAFAGGFGANQDRVVTVVTRIGDDPTTGVAWPVPHQPHNVSRTYCWWTSSPDAVPLTERFQLQGDPRHNPYFDLVAGGQSFPHGYNWHFDDLRTAVTDASPKWPCLDRDRLRDGFGAGAVTDAPRMLQLLRQSLQSCGGILVNACGPVAQALLLGGEVALPGPVPGAALSPVLVHGAFVGATAPAAVDTVTAPSPSLLLAGHQLVVGPSAEPFCALAWLGELWPDSHYGEYVTTGNLQAAASGFHRAPRNQAELPNLPAGTDFAFASGSALGLAGGVALLDAGTLGATFGQREDSAAPVGARTAAVESIAGATGDDLPEMLPNAWPFDVAVPFPGQLPYFEHTTAYPKSAVSLLEEHYAREDESVAAGCVALVAPAGGAATFLAVLGLSPAIVEEHTAAALGSLMLGVRTFHRAGEPAVEARITQLPLVEILEPSEGATHHDPTSILLRWKTRFVRFDGEPYTEGYPAGFAEPDRDLVYAVVYSRDEGETWHWASNSEPANLAQRPEPGLLFEDAGAGNETLVLPTPAEAFPGDEYVFRIQAYHASRQQHCSHHQVRVVLKR